MDYITKLVILTLAPVVLASVLGALFLASMYQRQAALQKLNTRAASYGASSSAMKLNTRAASYGASSSAMKPASKKSTSCNTINELRLVFAFLDKSGQGYVTVQRLATCLKDFGVGKSRGVAEDAAREVRAANLGSRSGLTNSAKDPNLSLENGIEDDTIITFEEFANAGLHSPFRGSAFDTVQSRVLGHMRKSPGRKVIYCFLLFTFLVLVGASSVLFEFFQCRRFELPNDEGGGYESYIRRDYSIACTSERYLLYVPYTVVMVLVYPVGIPLMYALLLFNNRKVLSDSAAMAAEEVEDFPRIGHALFLVEAYRPECYFFEIIECARRLLLASVIGIANSDSAASPVIGLLLSLFFIHIFERYSPFMSASDNDLSVILGFSLALLFLAALLIKVSATSDVKHDQAVFRTLLVGSVVLRPAPGSVGRRQGNLPSQTTEELKCRISDIRNT
jgi:hypothetical protein